MGTITNVSLAAPAAEPRTPEGDAALPLPALSRVPAANSSAKPATRERTETARRMPMLFLVIFRHIHAVRHVRQVAVIRRARRDYRLTE